VTFSTKIYFQFTGEYAAKNLRPVNLWLSYSLTGKKADCLTHSVCLGTVLLKDEEIARYLELLTVLR